MGSDGVKPEDKPGESLSTLEDPGSTVIEDGSNTLLAEEKTSQPDTPLPKQRRFRLKRLVPRFNIYSLGLFVIIAIIVGAILFAVRRNNQADRAESAGQSLSAEELSDLKNSDVNVGDPKQILTIESNTVINGRVLLRDDLDVAGTIKVGGSVNLPGITVAGTSNFNQIQANSLAVTGDTNIQGSLGIQRNLTVSGNVSVAGTLSATTLGIQTLSLSGDLQLNRHIDAGGNTPGKSDTGSLGSGGTTSVSGSDTAGTVTINTGGSPSAGCYVTVNFAQKFNATPHVVITPVGSAAGTLNYYVNRSSTSFSVCSTNAPSGGTTFSFDYIVID